MAWRLDAWSRFFEPAGWWFAAMVLVWLLFMTILFVVEPLLLGGWFYRRATADPAVAFRRVQQAHAVLLFAGTTVAAAGVLGAHGLLG